MTEPIDYRYRGTYDHERDPQNEPPAAEVGDAAVELVEYLRDAGFDARVDAAGVVHIDAEEALCGSLLLWHPDPRGGYVAWGCPDCEGRRVHVNEYGPRGPEEIE